MLLGGRFREEAPHNDQLRIVFHLIDRLEVACEFFSKDTLTNSGAMDIVMQLVCVVALPSVPSQK